MRVILLGLEIIHALKELSIACLPRILLLKLSDQLYVLLASRLDFEIELGRIC